jgi:hypothetical protein
MLKNETILEWFKETESVTAWNDVDKDIWQKEIYEIQAIMDGFCEAAQAEMEGFEGQLFSLTDLMQMPYGKCKGYCLYACPLEHRVKLIDSVYEYRISIYRFIQLWNIKVAPKKALDTAYSKIKHIEIILGWLLMIK